MSDIKTWRKRAEDAFSWPCLSADVAAPFMVSEIDEIRAAYENLLRELAASRALSNQHFDTILELRAELANQELCQYPTCQPQSEQQRVAAQVHTELYSGTLQDKGSQEIKRKARNQVTMDGHLNSALDSIMRSSSPDGTFCILGSLVEQAINATLSAITNDEPDAKP